MSDLISTAAFISPWPNSSPNFLSRSACCLSKSLCSPRTPKAWCRSVKLISTPIALGERLYSRWDFKPLLELGAVDIIQPDLSHAGGLLECRKIAAMAEVYDVAVAPHCPLGAARAGGLPAACCLHAQCCHSGDVARDPLQCRRHDLLTFVTNPEVLTPADGFLSIPTGPGLGVAIDEAAVREAHKDRHRWRNPIWRYQDGSFAEW